MHGLAALTCAVGLEPSCDTDSPRAFDLGQCMHRTAHRLSAAGIWLVVPPMQEAEAQRAALNAALLPQVRSLGPTLRLQCHQPWTCSALEAG